MEKTKAQKQAQKKYMDKFAVLRVRVSAEKGDTVKAHAAAQGESLNAFIIRAIDETLQRDQAARTAQAAAGDTLAPENADI